VISAKVAPRVIRSYTGSDFKYLRFYLDQNKATMRLIFGILPNDRSISEVIERPAMNGFPVRRVAHAQDALRLVTVPDRLAAFGRAVGHLMTRPAFAAAPFGHIARALAGQVNRGHYAFAQRGETIVGFVGWARASEAHAEAWLAGARALDGAEATAGDCVLLNFWQADTPEVSRFLIDRLAGVLAGSRRIYAKRHYPDGRIRPLRLDVTARAAASQARAAGR
jgi:hemolysin-activating ACP:hemolysin acyltransferase